MLRKSASLSAEMRRRTDVFREERAELLRDEGPLCIEFAAKSTVAVVASVVMAAFSGATLLAAGALSAGSLPARSGLALLASGAPLAGSAAVSSGAMLSASGTLSAVIALSSPRVVEDAVGAVVV